MKKRSSYDNAFDRYAIALKRFLAAFGTARLPVEDKDESKEGKS